MDITKFKRQTHPKISYTIETMLIHHRYNLSYYSEFSQMINYYQVDNTSSIKTAGVNFTRAGMNFYYNKNFIDSLNQKQVNFLVLHELFHLIFRHYKRTTRGGYDPKTSNIAQDGIINHIIVTDINKEFVTIPTDAQGHNSAIFIDKEYTDAEVFELYYFYLVKVKEETLKRRKKKQDEELFDDLFCLKYLPKLYECREDDTLIRNSLIPISKKKYTKCINNFTRRVLLIISQDLNVELIGHTDSQEDESVSDARANILKDAILYNVDVYAESYGYCLALIGLDIDRLSINEIEDYILLYEEYTSDTLKYQRRSELKKLKDTEKLNLFKQYKFTYFSKYNVTTLYDMCIEYGLEIPDTTELREQYRNLVKTNVITIGNGSSDKIIENDNDSEPCVLTTNAYKHKVYKNLVGISDTETKQSFNRRITYKFPEEHGNSGMGGDGDGYGENSKCGQMCWDLDHIFDDMDNNDGEFFDQHIPDEVSDEMREQMVKDADTRARARHKGNIPSSVENTLNKLTKKKKDYLRPIKQGVSFVKGDQKIKTYKRINRRGIIGIKGKMKIGVKLNVILDVSGSMSGGYIEKTLSYIFRSDIQINLIQADAKIQQVLDIKNMRQLQEMSIIGYGGTQLMPAVDYIVAKKNLNMLNTVILTDGYCDNLDLSKLKGKVLLITCGTDVPISKSNGKVRHIHTED